MTSDRKRTRWELAVVVRISRHQRPVRASLDVLRTRQRTPLRIRQSQLHKLSCTIEQQGIPLCAHPIPVHRAARVALNAVRVAVLARLLLRIAALGAGLKLAAALRVANNRGPVGTDLRILCARLRGTRREFAVVVRVACYRRAVAATPKVVWAPARVAAHGVASATVVVVAYFANRALDQAAGLDHAQNLRHSARAGIIICITCGPRARGEFAVVLRVAQHHRTVGASLDISRTAWFWAADMIASSAKVVVAHFVSAASC